MKLFKVLLVTVLTYLFYCWSVILEIKIQTNTLYKAVNFK